MPAELGVESCRGQAGALACLCTPDPCRRCPASLLLRPPRPPSFFGGSPLRVAGPAKPLGQCWCLPPGMGASLERGRSGNNRLDWLSSLTCCLYFGEVGESDQTDSCQIDSHARCSGTVLSLEIIESFQVGAVVRGRRIKPQTVVGRTHYHLARSCIRSSCRHSRQQSCSCNNTETSTRLPNNAIMFAIKRQHAHTDCVNALRTKATNVRMRERRKAE